MILLIDIHANGIKPFLTLKAAETS